MILIGTHFADELKTAGLLGLPFSWSTDGEITFGAAMTNAQVDAVNVVLAAHNPSTPVADIEAIRVATIKALTGAVINAKYSRDSGKQANMAARDAQLKDIASGRYYNSDGVLQAARALTAPELAELGATSAAWTWIQAVRSASNAAEAIAGKQATDIIWPVAP